MCACAVRSKKNISATAQGVLEERLRGNQTFRALTMKTEETQASISFETTSFRALARLAKS